MLLCSSGVLDQPLLQSLSPEMLQHRGKVPLNARLPDSSRKAGTPPSELLDGTSESSS